MEGSAIAEGYIVSAAESLPSDNLVPPPRLPHQYGDFLLWCCPTLFFFENYFQRPLSLHTLLSVNAQCVTNTLEIPSVGMAASHPVGVRWFTNCL